MHGDVLDRPVVISDASAHTMGSSLPRYVSTRVHHIVDERDFNSIVVLGSDDRSLIVSNKEKRDKLENWQRPTASVSGRSLTIHCFPGQAHVFHHASLVASHLALTGRDRDIVRLDRPEPSAIHKALRNSDLSTVRVTDIAVVASGNTYMTPAGAIWSERDTFWTRSELIGRRQVTWLAIKHSFWGDIAYHLGTLLAELGFKIVLFLGKLGSLRRDDVPNRLLVSGSVSHLGDRRVEWTSAYQFDDVAAWGTHVTLPSVLQETKEWFAQAAGKFDFIDPELGHFAAGVVASAARFGYLHIVSDNLAQSYPEDLSNEREGNVPAKRAALYGRIRAALERHLEDTEVS
jgi:hypothetical protein